VVGRFGSFEFPMADRYQFEAELGRGSMGTVYRARDLRLGRLVAIKMLHRVLTNELGVARFRSEVRIAAGLRHPNIVSLHEFDEVDDRLFYVMDYLEGESLRDRLRREKQLSMDEALRITRAVGEALQYAHDHDVIHRDIKPENIMLSDGRAWIVDFGLARAVGQIDPERLTSSGITVGTPQYLSPEQASAQKDVGPAADQYSLACVLYEMLIGRPPFDGPTAAAISTRHVREVPARVRSLRRSVPAGLDAAIARALEKDARDRFASVADFLAQFPSTAIFDPRAGSGILNPRLSQPATLAAAAVVLAAVLFVARGCVAS
jgi:serine/threonine-protein kinase